MIATLTPKYSWMSRFRRSHVLPGHVGQSSGRLGIHVPGSLAENLQIPDDGIDRLPVSGEGLE